MAERSADAPPRGIPTTREEARGSGIELRIFVPAAVLIAALVGYSVLFPQQAGNQLSDLQSRVVSAAGWYYVLLVVAFVLFSIFIGVSRFGKIRLGADDEEPEFRLASWFAMLFSAGMGIGLVFWAAAEPLSYFADPPPTSSPETPSGAAQIAITQVFLHWGIHAWAIYAVIALAIAYTVHRRGRPVSVRWVLEPLLGEERVKGRLGDLVDVVAVVSTLFGVANSLGFGVLQISAGLDTLGVVGATTPVQVSLIGIITLAAVVSVVSGLSRGIKWLSNVNLGLAGTMLLFVLVAGPTLFLLRAFVTNLGVYLREIPSLSFQTGAYGGQTAVDWQGTWTAFYWSTWIAWAPYVGVFIARISRGRTVREFMAGVLLVPTMISFLWFSVLGGTALHQQIVQGRALVNEDGSVDTDRALYQMLEGLPLSTIAIVVAIVLVTIFFVTSSDSGSLVVDMLSSGGNPDPPTWSRVFWAVTEGTVAAMLLVAGAASGGSGTGALAALRAASVVIALPFTLILIAAMIATYKGLNAEARERERAEQLMRTTALVAVALEAQARPDADHGDDGGELARVRHALALALGGGVGPGSLGLEGGIGGGGGDPGSGDGGGGDGGSSTGPPA